MGGLMSYSDLLAKSNTAASNTPSTTTPGGAASSTGKQFKFGTPSSVLSGKLPGSGIAITSKTPIPALTNTIDPIAASLPISATFPYNGIDTFPQLVNDSGTVIHPADFNRLISGHRTLQDFFTNILRYAPIDLLDRLGTADARYLNGVDTTNGINSSGIRRPLAITLGTKVTVTGLSNKWIATPSIALTSAQKTAIGLTTTVQALHGLTWRAGAKMMSSATDMTTLDPESCAVRVETRLDSNGTIQMFLCPGPYLPDDQVYTGLFQSNGGVPYIAPGLWYCWITLYLSPYIWP